MCACCCGANALAETFPVKARIAANNVYVRGGPGQNYYPTQKLDYGDEVEVYRRDPGGWLAIRPPRESYSWVSARYLKMVEPDIAVVTAEDVVARVGSQLSDKRDIWQVKLRRGEELRVLENAGAWLKVAPPSGEFRWISAQFVDLDSGDSARRVEVPRARDSWRQAEHAPHARSASTQTASRPGQRPFQRAPAASVVQEIRDIDLALSAEVCQRCGQWNFDQLKARAEGCLDFAQSDEQRGEIRQILSKIGRFEEIQLARRELRETSAVKGQRGQVALTRLDDSTTGSRPAPVSRLLAGSETAIIDSKYDGQGKLIPVKSNRVGAPQFALMDPNGKLQYFVTPAPGVNLRAYKNREVGVIGLTREANELGAPHIMVRRVAELPAGSMRR